MQSHKSITLSLSIKESPEGKESSLENILIESNANFEKCVIPNVPPLVKPQRGDICGLLALEVALAYGYDNESKALPRARKHDIKPTEEQKKASQPVSMRAYAKKAKLTEIGEITDFNHLKQIADKFNFKDCKPVKYNANPEDKNDEEAYTQLLLNIIKSGNSIILPADVSKERFPGSYEGKGAHWALAWGYIYKNNQYYLIVSQYGKNYLWSVKDIYHSNKQFPATFSGMAGAYYKDKQNDEYKKLENPLEIKQMNKKIKIIQETDTSNFKFTLLAVPAYQLKNQADMREVASLQSIFKSGNVDDIKLILRTHPKLILEYNNSQNKSFLEVMIQNQHYEAVKYLLEIRIFNTSVKYFEQKPVSFYIINDFFDFSWVEIGKNKLSMKDYILKNLQINDRKSEENTLNNHQFEELLQQLSESKLPDNYIVTCLSFTSPDDVSKFWQKKQISENVFYLYMLTFINNEDVRQQITKINIHLDPNNLIWAAHMLIELRKFTSTEKIMELVPTYNSIVQNIQWDNELFVNFFQSGLIVPTGADFSGIDFTLIPLGIINQLNFENTNLTNKNVEQLIGKGYYYFKDVNLDSAQISHLKYDQKKIASIELNFENAKMQKLDMKGIQNIPSANFDGADLKGANLSNAIFLNHVSFKNANLNQVNFNNIQFKSTFDFKGTIYQNISPELLKKLLPRSEGEDAFKLLPKLLISEMKQNTFFNKEYQKQVSEILKQLGTFKSVEEIAAFVYSKEKIDSKIKEILVFCKQLESNERSMNKRKMPIEPSPSILALQRQRKS